MKKIISVIVVAVLTCSFTMLCQASDMYDKQAGLEEIEKLSSEILEFVNSGYRGVYDGEPAEEKDIIRGRTRENDSRKSGSLDGAGIL